MKFLFKMHWTENPSRCYAEKKEVEIMQKMKRWMSCMLAMAAFSINPMTAYAGWETSGNSYRYQKEDGSYAAGEWITDGGHFYYLNQNGNMLANTTTPEGYLVAADGSWVEEYQVTGEYVRTPYDNLSYYFDPDWQRYIFDESTDYAAVPDTRILAAIRGIVPATDLSESNQMIYNEVCKFLIDFDYGASDYDKAKRVYEEVTGRASYNWGKYTEADDSVYSILVNGTGKCVGFSGTFKLLANAVGLKCGIRSDAAHMWNSVYIDGVAKSIDTSTTDTSAEFWLDMTKVICPVCGYEVTFGARDISRPCPKCLTQIDNPNM